ncbi:MAG: tetratricopeptide repeat protein [Terriglobia bacterium]
MSGGTAPSGAGAFRPSRRIIAWLILAGAVALQIPVRHSIDEMRASAEVTPEIQYVTSGEWLRRLSLGYDGLLADVYWTRAVQYYGTERLSPHPRFGLLGSLLRITTTLDPHLLAAYRFGAIFLAEKPPAGAGHPEEALQLLQRGITANPDEWRLWGDLGFIEYWDLRDYPAAARIFRTGSERPGAGLWMKALAAAVAARGGELQTSRILWSQIYRTAQNGSIRRSALEHLAAIQASEEIRALNGILAAFQRKEGRAATSFRDIVAAGFLRGLPRDPGGAPYEIGADGGVHLGSTSHVDLRLVE